MSGLSAHFHPQDQNRRPSADPDSTGFSSRSSGTMDIVRSPSMAAGFHDIGIECRQPPSVGRSLTYESPINLTAGNVFAGDCSVGAFSYFNGSSSFSNTSFGRYCSVAEGVCTAPGQHETAGFSTHPFIYDPEDGTARLGHFPAYRAILGKVKPTFLAGSRRSTAAATVSIGHDVWIGTRAIILNGVSIGHGAIVAAGAIVTKDVAPYTIVAGVPARAVRTRFDAATIAEFLAFGWWDYDLSTVSNRVDYGKPSEVLAFMREASRAGKLAAFHPPLWKLESVDGKAKITRLRA